MLKMSTDLVRHALNGPTMGTRWQVLFDAPKDFDVTAIKAEFQSAVSGVDAQMSTWKPDSDLMRLNAAPLDQWVTMPQNLVKVLSTALDIGRITGGAFDIGVGDAVAAWGFGPAEADENSIRAALAHPRRPAHETVELDVTTCRARKHERISLDLSGIAKGFAVDRLAEVAAHFGINAALLAIDGELRGYGLQPNGTPWSVAIERPDYEMRTPHAMLMLHDVAVATSGDYRHWAEVGGRKLAHTMDPRRGGPIASSPASVTVLAATCMEADAWATALMVRGSVSGSDLARTNNVAALFIDRVGDQLRETRVGTVFDCQSALRGTPKAAR